MEASAPAGAWARSPSLRRRAPGGGAGAGLAPGPGLLVGPTAWAGGRRVCEGPRGPRPGLPSCPPPSLLVGPSSACLMPAALAARASHAWARRAIARGPPGPGRPKELGRLLVARRVGAC